MMRRGFTVVELIITITVMGILLTLAVVGMNASQANARDSERRGDVEAIAMHLEAYYNNDSMDSQGNFFMSGGTYPGTSYIETDSTFQRILPDIDPKSIHAPGVDLDDAKSLVIATNTTQSTAAITPRPSTANDVYVYQAIATDGSECYDPFVQAGGCRKFNLYYYQETTNTVEMITSKNQ